MAKSKNWKSTLFVNIRIQANTSQVESQTKMPSHTGEKVPITAVMACAR